MRRSENDGIASRGFGLTRDEVLAALTTSLRDLTAWLTDRGIPHAIIGGVAVALRGNARFTQDIESVLDAAESIDLKRVRHWVRLMADALDDPEIAERPENLLAKRSPRTPAKKKRRKSP